MIEESKNEILTAISILSILAKNNNEYLIPLIIALMIEAEIYLELGKMRDFFDICFQIRMHILVITKQK